MRPIPSPVLNRLLLEDALTEESQSWQSLIPPTPGSEWIVQDVATFAGWLKGQLARGLTTAPQVIVPVRKPPQGIRPVPVWGYAERITYRALVNFVLRNHPKLSRTPEDYLEFLGQPIHYARSLESTKAGRWRVALTSRSAKVQYVVISDITAFYEYVDHQIMARELLSLTGDYAAIECLIELLAEVQGKILRTPAAA